MSKVGGDEVDDTERVQYRVRLLAGGEAIDVIPFALGDLHDGDNHHLLCLDVEGQPLAVAFPAGYLTDPNDDALNPETEAPVQAASVVETEAGA